MAYHLAQINIARLVAPLGDPRLVDFAAQLDPVNKLADAGELTPYRPAAI